MFSACDACVTWLRRDFRATRSNSKRSDPLPKFGALGPEARSLFRGPPSKTRVNTMRVSGGRFRVPANVPHALREITRAYFLLIHRLCLGTQGPNSSLDLAQKEDAPKGGALHSLKRNESNKLGLRPPALLSARASR